jgi:hypothetical protein
MNTCRWSPRGWPQRSHSGEFWQAGQTKIGIPDPGTESPQCRQIAIPPFIGNGWRLLYRLALGRMIRVVALMLSLEKAQSQELTVELET